MENRIYILFPNGSTKTQVIFCGNCLSELDISRLMGDMMQYIGTNQPELIGSIFNPMRLEYRDSNNIVRFSYII